MKIILLLLTIGYYKVNGGCLSCRSVKLSFDISQTESDEFVTITKHEKDYSIQYDVQPNKRTKLKKIYDCLELIYEFTKRSKYGSITTIWSKLQAKVIFVTIQPKKQKDIDVLYFYKFADGWGRIREGCYLFLKYKLANGDIITQELIDEFQNMTDYNECKY